jgi:hypothetical protein
MDDKFFKKFEILAKKEWWYMPLIPATLEAKVGG